MQLTWRLGWLCAVASGLAACSGSDTEDTEATEVIPCDVQQVLQAKCLRCHDDPPQLDAPYLFTSLENIHEVRGDKPVYERIQLTLEVDYMPPLGVETEPPVEPLTATEKDVLLQWVRAGAPGESMGCRRSVSQLPSPI